MTKARVLTIPIIGAVWEGRCSAQKTSPATGNPVRHESLCGGQTGRDEPSEARLVHRLPPVIQELECSS